MASPENPESLRLIEQATCAKLEPNPADHSALALTKTHIVAPEIIVGDPFSYTVSWTESFGGDDGGLQGSWNDGDASTTAKTITPTIEDVRSGRYGDPKYALKEVPAQFYFEQRPDEAHDLLVVPEHISTHGLAAALWRTTRRLAPDWQEQAWTRGVGRMPGRRQQHIQKTLNAQAMHELLEQLGLPAPGTGDTRPIGMDWRETGLTQASRELNLGKAEEQRIATEDKERRIAAFTRIARRAQGSANLSNGWVVTPDGRLRQHDHMEGSPRTIEKYGEGVLVWEQLDPAELVLKWGMSSKKSPHVFTVMQAPAELTEAQRQAVTRIEDDLEDRFYQVKRDAKSVAQGWGIGSSRQEDSAVIAGKEAVLAARDEVADFLTAYESKLDTATYNQLVEYEAVEEDELPVSSGALHQWSSKVQSALAQAKGLLEGAKSVEQSPAVRAEEAPAGSGTMTLEDQMAALRNKFGS